MAHSWFTHTTLKRHGLYLAMLVLCCGAYFVTARFGLLMDAVSGFATLVWPPTGISLAVLLLGGYRFWPAITVGALLANWTTGAPLASACGIALGNTLEALLGTYLLRRHHFQPSLKRLQDSVNLIVFAAMLSTLVSATLGVTSLWLAGMITSAAFLPTWSVWWIGDALGALIITPLILVWHRWQLPSGRDIFRHILEVLAFACLLTAMHFIIFGSSFNLDLAVASAPYLAFPVMIWVALRLGVRATATTTFFISVAAIWATAQKVGPFSGSTLSEALTRLHFFIGTLAVTALTLAAAVAERVRANRLAQESAVRSAAEDKLRSMVHIQSVHLEVTRILTEAKSVGEAFEKSFETVCRGLDWDLGALWSVDEVGEKLIFSHYWHRDSSSLRDFAAISQHLTFSLGLGLPGRVWLSLQPTWIVDVTVDSNFLRASAAAKSHLHGAVAFPVLAGQKFIGVIEFYSHHFHTPDTKLLEMMADIGTRLGSFLQRKNAEENLRQTKERYTLLIEAIKDYAIFMLDPSGHIVSWNAGAEKIKGYKAYEIIGKHFSIFYPREAIEINFPEYELKMAQEKGSFEDEGWRIRKDGSTFWANVIITPLYDSNGKLYGFSKVARDITEQRQMADRQSQIQRDLEQAVAERTKELLLAKEAADTANTAKSTFLANMSHEIRTPLGAVLGFSELITHEHLSPAEKAHYLSAIKRNGELLSNIINDILDLSKVEAGKLVVHLQDVTITEVLTDLTSFLHLQATDKGIHLSVSQEGAIPPIIRTDALRLRQILMNIVGNAIKFTQRGFVEVKIKMIPGTKGGSKLMFAVTDSGSGIDPMQAGKLFRPFTQADATAKRKHGGTGLGLVLAKRLARLLGGDVVLVESTPGQGSTFTITIDPRIGNITTQEAPTQILTPSTQQAKACSSIRLEGVHVLLVEDAPDNQLLVSQMLKIAGAQVDTAANGKEALEKVAARAYDVVLMDLQMPIMDGYEATMQLRKSGSNLPIIALTAHALKEEKLHCLASGFSDHISKPVDRFTLLKSIAQHSGTNS